jgi:hypothetical protein
MAGVRWLDIAILAEAFMSWRACGGAIDHAIVAARYAIRMTHGLFFEIACLIFLTENGDARGLRRGARKKAVGRVRGVRCKVVVRVSRVKTRLVPRKGR